MALPLPPHVTLRAFREWKGLTLEQVAAEIRHQGVDISTYGLNNIELGHKPASEAVLTALAKVLYVDRSRIRAGHELIQLVNAVQAENGCTCRAGLPRNRRTVNRTPAVSAA